VFSVTFAVIVIVYGIGVVLLSLDSRVKATGNIIERSQDVYLLVERNRSRFTSKMILYIIYRSIYTQPMSALTCISMTSYFDSSVHREMFNLDPQTDQPFSALNRQNIPPYLIGRYNYVLLLTWQLVVREIIYFVVSISAFTMEPPPLHEVSSA